MTPEQLIKVLEDMPGDAVIDEVKVRGNDVTFRLRTEFPVIRTTVVLGEPEDDPQLPLFPDE